MAELCCLVGMCLGGTIVALFCVREPREILATCDAWPTLVAELADDGPEVTVVVRCGPVVRGPNVAPMWPQRSRAWKARPGTPPSRDPTPMAQLRVFLDRPLLSVADRQGPMLRARRGHGTARTNPVPRGSDGYKLN